MAIGFCEATLSFLFCSVEWFAFWLFHVRSIRTYTGPLYDEPVVGSPIILPSRTRFDTTHKSFV